MLANLKRLLSLAIILKHNCLSEIISSQLKDTNFYKTAPKPWHAYVRNFIHKYLKTRTKCVAWFLFEMTKYSKIQKMLGDHVVNFNCTNKINRSKPPRIGCCRFQSPPLLFLPFVAGKLLSDMHWGRKSRKCRNPYDIRSSDMHFKLHPSLSLNLTFHVIYMPDRFLRIGPLDDLESAER